MCNATVICPWEHNGHAHGCDKGSCGSLRTPEGHTTGPIHSKSSSLEPSWSVDMQRRGFFAHGGIMDMPICMIIAPGILRTTELRIHWADSLQNKFTGIVLACRYATSWSFAHGCIMGMSMTMIWAHGILWTPELSNHMADLLQIKFTGTIFACRCARSWSFTHGGIICMSMGVIKAPGILRIPKLSNHWADSIQIKSIGTVLICRCATSCHSLMGV